MGRLEDMKLRAAMTASGRFGDVSYGNGQVTVEGTTYPTTACQMRVEQGADVRRRGWTLTTGAIGSSNLKGHMHLVVVTPDGEHLVTFKANAAEKAEKFAARFTSAAQTLRSAPQPVDASQSAITPNGSDSGPVNSGKVPATQDRPVYRRRWFLVLAVAVVIVLIVVLSRCGSSGGTPAGSPTTAVQTQTSSSSATTASATESNPGTAPNFAVTIDSTSQTTDDAGNPALLVTFTFTNNSGAAIAFMDTGFTSGTDPVSVRAFQGNNELNSAAINGDDTDAANSEKTIAPGGSVQIHWAYELLDKSDVTVNATVTVNGQDVILDTKTVPVN